MGDSDVIARVLIDSSLPQLDKLFDYRIPDAVQAEAVAGVRVRVPLRSAGRIADGFIVETTDSVSHAGVLSELDSVVSPVRMLAPEVWALARRVADRAAGNASDVIRLAVPKRQVRVEKAWLAAQEQSPAEPVSAAEFRDYDGQRLGAAIESGQRLAIDAIPRVVRLPDGSWVGQWATTMAAAATRSLALGRPAILAVPDYRDQEQLMAALAAVLPPDRIVRLDARQSNPDRYRAVLACLGELPLAIVGNRSVVYAPGRNLGLIAVWDDGDPLHAEPLSPYVHVRDAALVRQEQQGCALLFLGHTRSTEVQRLVELGWVESAGPERSYLPRVIPTAQQVPENGPMGEARIPSTAWREARSALDSGPVLVQVARPGYAPRLLCEGCRQGARCLRCDGPLGMRTPRSTPSCGWCGALAAEWSCQNCGGRRYRLSGAGASRTAEELGRAFPGVRVVVADGERPIMTVSEQPALVIATRGAEPIAAGGYRAVLLLDGDRMIARESLRVGEDCLRWWANAIALAAEGAPSILVGVGGSLAVALATWRLPDYARSELNDRRRLRFPPAVRVATLAGPTEVVEKAIASIPGLTSIPGLNSADSRVIDVLGPVETEDGNVRSIVRFDYADGAAVATALRAEIIRGATGRRTAIAGTGYQAPMPKLKVRFDDTELL
jgi:primosomal protein N' (replication factor Y)